MDIADPNKTILTGEMLRHSIHAWFADFMQALKTARPVPLPATVHERTALARPYR